MFFIAWGGTRMEGDVGRGERGQGSWASPAWLWLEGDSGWWVGGATAKDIASFENKVSRQRL